MAPPAPNVAQRRRHGATEPPAHIARLSAGHRLGHENGVKIARAAALLLALSAAGCADKRAVPLVPVAPTAVLASTPLGLDRGLSPGERVWHLRAALNVAALGCPAPTGGAIIDRYNRLLRDRKGALASAYQAEIAVFRDRHGSGWQPQFDRYMTSLYNRLAAPTAQPAFCPLAAAIADEALAATDIQQFAGPALARIEAAFVAPPPVPFAAPAIAAAPSIAAAYWRIQLGAYTGAAAAAAAWDRIRARQPGLAGYAPHFEPVPARPELVRLRIGDAVDRGNALTLCALAAAGGFDCIPVRSK